MCASWRPVTLQTTYLPRIKVEAMQSAGALVDGDVRIADDATPQFDFRFHQRPEFAGSAVHGFDSLFAELRFHVAQLHGRAQLGVQPLDDGRRCRSGYEEPESADDAVPFV